MVVNSSGECVFFAACWDTLSIMTSKSPYSGRMVPRALRPHEYLEKLLNKSTLTTQRVTHYNVLDVGGKVYRGYDKDQSDTRQREIDEAVNKAENRARREREAAMKRQAEQLEEKRQKDLAAQKLHFQQVAERVAIQRDKLESERLAELAAKMSAENEEALRLAWEEAERRKAEAVRKACEDLTIKLNRDHALDKEMCIANALKEARGKFKKKLDKTVAETIAECGRLADLETARVAQLHADEIERHEIRYKELKDKYHAEHAHRQKVEDDFKNLQTDYQRFMNYTDGKYHSDYMMSLRNHGLRLSEKRLSDVSEYNEKQIPDIKLPFRQKTQRNKLSRQTTG